jgi:hypothetical protein
VLIERNAVLVEAKEMVTVKHLDGATRVLELGQVIRFVRALKVAKCLFSENSLKEGSIELGFKPPVQL